LAAQRRDHRAAHAHRGAPGQIRDHESTWTQQAIQRITTENITLKQRGRQRATDKRTLDERVKAARSNVRFQDRALLISKPS
jgi:hypothetical protein